MWGESSKDCEVNCQCSGLITDSFKINSGNNATKRKQEEAVTTNYKLRMLPNSLEFKSPSHTPSKRRILGELQNSGLNSSFSSQINSILRSDKSPLTKNLGESQNFGYSSNSRNIYQSDKSQLSKNMENTSKSPLSRDMENILPLSREMENMTWSNESPLFSKDVCKENKSPLLSRNIDNVSRINGNRSPLFSRNVDSVSRGNEKSPLFRNENVRSPLYLSKESHFLSEDSFLPKKSPVIERILTPLKKSPLIDNNTSPVTTRTSFSLKRTKTCSTKISRIFEERSKFKISNKENVLSETFMKIDVEEETQDCTFTESFSGTSSWSTTKLDFTSALQSTSFDPPKTDTVPDKPDLEFDQDMETLHDLEEEFDNDNFDSCTKYEIISTDSPNIISRGRSSSRKVESKNFTFGAPLAESEQSTSFNRPNVTATRSLNFEDVSFEFTSPAARKPQLVKKSLKFSETPTKKVLTQDFLTPTKNPLRHERSDSSIGSMASFSSSPSCSQIRLFTSESTTSMESGFISELEEPFLELEDTSNSPKVPNFNDLLSGQIKENFLTENFLKRPSLQRSLSYNPEAKSKSLFSIKESPDVKKSQKRTEVTDVTDVDVANKRRRSNCASPEIVKARPVLQRAFSENHASIMSAVARSSEEADLIGDFSAPCALPLVQSDHSELRCISAETLASLLAGDFDDTISSYQVIDCRYPYEFEGGHIPGAINLYTPAQVKSLLDNPTGGASCGKRHVLVFHCEFSLERGPKLYRYLRSTDRSKNRENYPNLTYPEIYLLHKGYSSFYKNYPELCASGYTMMLDPKHSQLLRKHRSIEEPASFFTHHRSKPGSRLMF